MMADPSPRILVRGGGAFSHHRFFSVELSPVRWQSTDPKGRNAKAGDKALAKEFEIASNFAFRGHDKRPAILA
jgi:hypothetical protein